MARPRPRPAGWYPDPEDESSIRHWDGRRWGGERRPRPSWAKSGEPGEAGDAGGAGQAGDADTGSPRRRGRRWRVAAWLAGAVGLVAAMAGASGVGRGSDVPPRTVQDREFTRQADAACRRTLPDLREDRPRRPRDVGDDQALGRRVGRTADRLDALADEIRGLPVAAADQAEVARWLADWDAYVEVGHRYAEALERRERERYQAIEQDGNAVSRRLFRFARANDMPACIF